MVSPYLVSSGNLTANQSLLVTWVAIASDVQRYIVLDVRPTLLLSLALGAIPLRKSWLQ